MEPDKRREVVATLLSHVDRLMGEDRCGFRSCYGEVVAVFEIQLFLRGETRGVEFGTCEDHEALSTLAGETAPDQPSLAGFFIMHLDDRFGLKEVAERARTSNSDLN